MEAQKILVKESDVATIACPSCDKTKKFSVESCRQKSKRDLLVKCSCENVFSVCLEYRKDRRKSVKLLGKSINFSNHRESQDIIIKNISMGGAGFCPFKKYKTKQDDRLQVFFELNECNNTPVKKDVTVRTANHDYVGSEFNDKQRIDSSLGLYLLD